MSVRVRFAPSPTGPLHIGGVRTLLYNYLFAKAQGGAFLLRIEDTDQKRWVEHSEPYIESVLEWLGIVPDEGPSQGGPYAPYRQSERKERYGAYAHQLVEQGAAYYAFDTTEELTAMRERQQAIGTKSSSYNAIARMAMQNSLSLPQEEVKRRIEGKEPYVIRLHIDPKKSIKYKDEVRGWIQVQGSTLDDKVLLKEDGMPTYHLANVVDDHQMKISHVIRGEEWLPSTPTHILLYEAFGWAPPLFAHLPLLLRANGQGKLSKRSAHEVGMPIFPLSWYDKGADATYPGFCEKGYLPEALINFLALLGWSPGGNQELMTLQELIEKFSLKRINKAGVRFDINKLKWFNQQYLRALPDRELIEKYLRPELAKAGITASEDYLQKVCEIGKERIFFPRDLWQEVAYFFLAPAHYPWDVITKRWKPAMQALFEAIISKFDALAGEPLPEDFKMSIKGQAKNHDYKVGLVMKLVRMAVTGQEAGHDLSQTLSYLGKREVVCRLRNALVSWQEKIPADEVT